MYKIYVLPSDIIVYLQVVLPTEDTCAYNRVQLRIVVLGDELTRLV